MIKFCAFDIDGVIYSSENIIQTSYSKAVKQYIKENNNFNFPIPTKSEIIAQIGKTYKDIVSNLFPGITEKDAKGLRKLLLAILEEEIRSKNGIFYNKIVKVLKDLKEMDIIIGTGSNGAETYCNAILETYEIKKFFQEQKYVDFETYYEKTDLLKYYLKKYNLKSNELLFIGDRITDYNAAKNVNCIFIGVKGHGHDDELKDSDYIINDLLKIPSIAKKIK